MLRLKRQQSPDLRYRMGHPTSLDTLRQSTTPQTLLVLGPGDADVLRHPRRGSCVVTATPCFCHANVDPLFPSRRILCLSVIKCICLLMSLVEVFVDVFHCIPGLFMMIVVAACCSCFFTSNCILR